MKNAALRWTLTAGALAAVVVSLPAQAHAKKIAVVEWNEVEPRYGAQARKMIADLQNEGVPADQISVEYFDGHGSKEKIGDAIKSAMASHPDMYAAMGTSAVVPLAKEVTDKPIIFDIVYDPIGAKVAKSWESSGNNVTGGSNFVSISAFLHRLVKRSSLKVKTVEVLYTAGEKNSELELAEVKAGEQDLGITVTGTSIKTPEEVKQWAAGLGKSKPDMIVLTGANAVGTNIAAITAAADKHKVMTVTHLEDIVQRGALYGLVADADQVSAIAGKAMARVIHGEQPSAIRIEYPLPKLLINKATADKDGFTIPDTLKEWAAGNSASK